LHRKHNQNLNNMKKNLLITILFTFISWTMLYAQGVTTASIGGRVAGSKSGEITGQNASGEGLPGANVVAVHTPSGTTYGTVTQPDGLFTIPNMRVGGPYTVKVSFIGYRDANFDQIYLQLGEKFDLPVVLAEESTQLEELVVTSGQGDVFSSDRTGASTNINNQQIQRLPTISRDFGDYTRLTPQSNGGNSFGGRSDRYNNITIDGALFNNSFGLSGTVGGQTNAQPISLDAVDQITTSIAPYDVTQGSFTGAGINVVTRSGTNDFSGSVYFFTRNQNFIGSKIASETNKYQNFSSNNMGFRLGGPIIKNKLFFFANYERERVNPPATTFSASRDGSSGPTISQADGTVLDKLSSFLKSTYGYDPGSYENYTLQQNSDKATFKLDWNINKSNKFSIKYNFLNSYSDNFPSRSSSSNPYGGGRSPSQLALPFFGAYYRQFNNFNSVIAELNSTIGNSFSNKFQVGYTAYRDFRKPPTPSKAFPLVDIGDGATTSQQTYTSFGYEFFTANNLTNSNVFQISDNFDIYKGKHTFTVGTYNEFYQFENGFGPGYYGHYKFKSLADFYASAGFDPNSGTSVTPQTGKVDLYELNYAANIDGTFPIVKVSAFQLGFYGQDRLQVNERVNVTFGVRADIPFINSNIARNETVANLTFSEGAHIETDKVQKTSILWSPRFGFNWDVKGDKSTQLRGGTGIFTGRVPYVWISNQASNNGLLFNLYSPKSTDLTNLLFSEDVDKYRPTGQAAVAAKDKLVLAVTDNNFKFPQVWRTNIAVDQKLPAGIIGSLDIAFTKDLNAVYFKNVNLPDPTSVSSVADNRPIYSSNKLNGNIDNAILMSNTNKGYSYFLTVQAKKRFGKNLDIMLAYTYTDAKAVNDGTSSVANSNFQNNPIYGSPNANVLGLYNSFVKHRIISSLNYRVSYTKFMSTSIGLFYSLAPSGRFSYTYNGDMNGDGVRGNDLIFVPKDRSQIKLSDITNTTTKEVYTADDQWKDLDAYINQDKYLSSRRGKYAERNGAVAPWRGQLDFRLLQDFYVNVGKYRNTIQLSVDILNVGNLIYSDWGVLQIPNRPGLISFAGYDSDKVPIFQFPYLSGKTPLTSTYRNDLGIISRWQMQLGIRYIFN